MILLRNESCGKFITLTQHKQIIILNIIGEFMRYPTVIMLALTLTACSSGAPQSLPNPSASPTVSSSTSPDVDQTNTQEPTTSPDGQTAADTKAVFKVYVNDKLAFEGSNPLRVQGNNSDGFWAGLYQSPHNMAHPYAYFDFPSYSDSEGSELPEGKNPIELENNYKDKFLPSININVPSSAFGLTAEESAAFIPVHPDVSGTPKTQKSVKVSDVQFTSFNDMLSGSFTYKTTFKVPFMGEPAYRDKLPADANIKVEFAIPYVNGRLSAYKFGEDIQCHVEDTPCTLK